MQTQSQLLLRSGSTRDVHHSQLSQRFLNSREEDGPHRAPLTDHSSLPEEDSCSPNLERPRVEAHETMPLEQDRFWELHARTCRRIRAAYGSAQDSAEHGTESNGEMFVKAKRLRGFRLAMEAHFFPQHQSLSTIGFVTSTCSWVVL